MMNIDSHLHIWSLDTDAYPFAEGRNTEEEGSAELLLETMEANGVSHSVIVQPIHYVYDNRYVTDMMKKYPGKFAGMAIMDRHAPDAPEQLEKLVKEDGFSGLRMHLSRPDDPAEWAAPDQDRIWQKAEELGASFLSFGPAEKQPAVEPIVARYPNVKVILDHLGGAPTLEEAPYPLLQNVLNFAKYPNVYVKFTPQAGQSKEDFPLADTHSTYERLYDAFGPQRLMWGTDFPHIFRNIGYPKAVEMFRDHMPFLSEEDKEWLFAKTALSVWSF